MLMYVFFIALSSIFISAENCDEYGILIYEDLGCTPIYDSDKKCPKKYSCKGFEPCKKYCYFQGKSYKAEELIENGAKIPPCYVGCLCAQQAEEYRFMCAVVDCPFFRDEKPNCYGNHTLDKCCAVGQICPPFDNIATCLVEGTTYQEGQKFYPSNTCLECVCRKGFKGKFEEPFCQRRICGEQLYGTEKIQAKCAPFYSINKVACCPYNWICPDGTETIKGNATSEESCKFGNRTVKVGQHFEKRTSEGASGHSFTKVKCECVIPPLMKCIEIVRKVDVQ